MSVIERVVLLAQTAHVSNWSMDSDVGKQTSKAVKTCRQWQESVVKELGARMKPERGTDVDGLNQKIDLLDIDEMVAYELKVSPNNVHMEIYRDVFKVLVYNEHHKKQRIKKLVFIAPEKGQKSVPADFISTVQLIVKRHEVHLEVRWI